MTLSLHYFENIRHEKFTEFAMLSKNSITALFGYTSFIWDIEPSSKRVVERTGNLVIYREMNDGDHFAATEFPEGLIGDTRELVGIALEKRASRS
ncbi:hypothetical protein DL98DRAFT_276226 [Cadophora sp. DSE1049]|nr:hypothetical protein DL98DRAFT_276226 [Cadophora sp. DSE1049]